MSVISSTAGEVHSDLGANHHMWTYADLYDNNWLAGRTRTASFTWFGGYVGTMACIVVDKDLRVFGTTEMLRFGVNGTAWGGSDRTDQWNLPMRPVNAGAGPPARVLVAHSWKFDARVLVSMAEAAKTVWPILAALV
ncbi:hypothetical protein [Isoptericola sp. NPDC056134]|uniref:hypothetical protein n=1 Tax=Isoptericola sp. NPDC056134 TaxID=3345723 RepID=UPI0035ED274A